MAIRILIATMICSVAGPLALRARAGDPALTVDLRATSTSNGTILDPKHVVFTGGVGGTVTMDVFAIVSGYSNQWTDYLHGSFLSSTGGLMGDLRAQLVHD
jgi:hypothetical protein